MTIATPPAPALPANSRQEIRAHLVNHRLSWTSPLLVVVARTVFILLAQAFAALIFFLRGSRAPWLAAAPWWTVYANLVDIGCLALLWKFTRAEGITIRDLIGPVRLRYGRDIFLGILAFLCIFPCFVVGGTLAAHWVYGTYQVSVYPGIMFGRVLPVWASLFSRFIWWIVWSPTEEITYNGYALPRLQALTGRTWLAVAIVAFCWTIQHPFFPFIADARLFLWRFLGFLPGIIVLCLLYLRLRRLAPLILAHWSMDIIATFMTLQS